MWENLGINFRNLKKKMPVCRFNVGKTFTLNDFKILYVYKKIVETFNGVLFFQMDEESSPSVLEEINMHFEKTPSVSFAQNFQKLLISAIFELIRTGQAYIDSPKTINKLSYNKISDPSINIDLFYSLKSNDNLNIFLKIGNFEKDIVLCTSRNGKWYPSRMLKSAFLGSVQGVNYVLLGCKEDKVTYQLICGVMKLKTPRFLFSEKFSKEKQLSVLYKDVLKKGIVNKAIKRFIKTKLECTNGTPQFDMIYDINQEIALKDFFSFTILPLESKIVDLKSENKLCPERILIEGDSYLYNNCNLLGIGNVIWDDVEMCLHPDEEEHHHKQQTNNISWLDLDKVFKVIVTGEEMWCESSIQKCPDDSFVLTAMGYFVKITMNGKIYLIKIA